MRAIVLLFPLLLLIVFALVVARRQRKARAQLLELQEANRSKQEFVMARLDEIAKLIEDRVRSNEELQAAFDLIITQMMAIDTDGSLAPLVADSENYFAGHLAKRGAGTAPGA